MNGQDTNRMVVPKDLKYTKEHEWVRVEGAVGTVGITDYAQGELGDVVFVELPQKNKSVSQMDECATVESVKTVSSIFSPVSGSIMDVNTELSNNPENINKDPYHKGWIFKIRLTHPEELGSLLDANGYESHIAAQAH